ncbi:MAG: cell wall metabolism sensor histidine kinase WalK [Lachnospiraceae bacterium]|nr:cell wall metabolism sensor histidine kinase WalK [Lachnospiraceae bacterium]
MREASKKILLRFKWLRSLRARLFVIIFLIGFIPSAIMRYATIASYEDRGIDVRRSDVQNQLKIIADHLIKYNYLLDSSSEIVNAELNQMANLYDGRILVINGALRVIKDTYNLIEGKSIVSEQVIRGLRGANLSNYDQANRYIEIVTPIIETVSALNASPEIPEGTEIIHGVILTSVSSDSINTTREILARKSAIVETILFFLLIAIAIIGANILVIPFDRVTRAISQVKEGLFDEPITVTDYTETEHILDAFNQLLKRMKVIDDSRNEFVSNVSHELKTPITSMKVLADSLITQNDVPVEIYHEFLVDIAAEIEREDKIINDLLTLVKMDKSAALLNIGIVDINALTEIVLKRLRPIARKKDIELVLESTREVIAVADEVKISLILTNLIENAIKYNKEQGTVTVTINADHQFFTIEVKDTGNGIPEDTVDRIFERFYRVDKSHSREIAGTGLGLAITKNAVMLHMGTINVASTLGEGTIFTVKIPLNYITK